jgi:alanyl-tRNA synthetase
MAAVAESIQKRLGDKEFLDGAKAGAQDVAALKQLLGDNPTNILRWLKNMASFTPEERAALSGPSREEKKAAKESGKEAGKVKDVEKERSNKIKAVVKEGGKKAQDIAGAADMGGIQWFCSAITEADGEMEFLSMAMDAMNVEVDPAGEERKGGAGNISKMLISAGNERLALICNVPEDKATQLSAKDWMSHVLEVIGGSFVGEATDNLAKGELLANPDKNVFPLKVRDVAIPAAYSFLKAKGCVPDKADESDDEFCYGDDDFPE